MHKRAATPDPKASFSIQVGSWLTASATGWGVVAVPIILLIVVAAILLRQVV